MKKYEADFGDGGAKLLARRWSVPEEKIRTWVNHYRLHGIDGLHPKRSSYSAQVKLEMLSYQDRERLSSRQVAAVYDIRNPNQVVVWQRILDAGGAAALESKKEYRPDMKSTRTRPDPSSASPPDSAQSLREENERLRAEVAYLNKIHALIREKRSTAPTKRARSSD
jgi:transposase